jgi:hypothetical protein
LRITLEGSVGRDHGTAPGIASALHAPVVGSAAQLQVRHTLAVTHEAGDLAASTGNADGTPVLVSPALSKKTTHRYRKIAFFGYLTNTVGV